MRGNLESFIRSRAISRPTYSILFALYIFVLITLHTNYIFFNHIIFDHVRSVWFCLFLGAFVKLLKEIISFVVSVCPSAWNNSAPTRRIVMKLNMSFLRKSVHKLQVSLKSDKNNRYFTRRRFHIITISRWIILRMRNVSDKRCRETQNTYFMFINFFPKIVRLMR